MPAFHVPAYLLANRECRFNHIGAVPDLPTLKPIQPSDFGETPGLLKPLTKRASEPVMSNRIATERMAVFLGRI